MFDSKSGLVWMRSLLVVILIFFCDNMVFEYNKFWFFSLISEEVVVNCKLMFGL